MTSGEGNRQNGEDRARRAQLMEGCGSGLFEEATSGGVGSSLVGGRVRSRRGRRGAGRPAPRSRCLERGRPPAKRPGRAAASQTSLRFPETSFCKQYASHCDPAPRQTHGWQLLTNGHQSLAAQDLPSDSRTEHLEEQVLEIARVRGGLCAHEAPHTPRHRRGTGHRQHGATPARPAPPCPSTPLSVSLRIASRSFQPRSPRLCGTNGGADCTGKQVAKREGRFRKRRQRGAGQGY